MENPGQFRVEINTPWAVADPQGYLDEQWASQRLGKSAMALKYRHTDVGA
jgi:hypothetical protein